jgi:microcystin-dependent protein
MEAYIGQIILFAGNFAPKNWAFCDGRLMSISQNTALFSILGTTYGGDGIRTFALPDLRGRAPVHTGQGPGLSHVAQGEVYGSSQTTLLLPNLPAGGTATIQATNNPATTNDPTNALLASGDEEIFSNEPVSGTLNLASSVNPGSSQPIPVGGPRLALNYIICLYGIYPSRS